MTEHTLLVKPPYFDALLDGSKTFEVRRNDRAFQAGDTLVLLDTSLTVENTAAKAENERLIRIGAEWAANYQSWVDAADAAEAERDRLRNTIRDARMAMESEITAYLPDGADHCEVAVNNAYRHAIDLLAAVVAGVDDKEAAT